MKFSRKSTGTNKWLHLLIILAGLGLVYSGFSVLHWTWNIVTLPFGLLITVIGFRNYRATNRIVREIEFTETGLNLHFMDGSQDSIFYAELTYALLVRKGINPIRSIEFQKMSKSGVFGRGKVGRIYFLSWGPQIENIAQHLIRQDYPRKKWAYSLTLSDIFMLLSLVTGFVDPSGDSYAEGLSASDNLRHASMELDILEEKERKAAEEQEKKFIKKTKE